MVRVVAAAEAITADTLAEEGCRDRPAVDLERPTGTFKAAAPFGDFDADSVRSTAEVAACRPALRNAELFARSD
jgi:hypothetical protein